MENVCPDAVTDTLSNLPHKKYDPGIKNILENIFRENFSEKCVKKRSDSANEYDKVVNQQRWIFAADQGASEYGARRRLNPTSSAGRNAGDVEMRQKDKLMVPRVRIELTTTSSSGKCSTIELPRRLRNFSRVQKKPVFFKISTKLHIFPPFLYSSSVMVPIA